MTAEFKIKQHILLEAIGAADFEWNKDVETEAQIQDAYKKLDEDCSYIGDYESEFRDSYDYETDIECEHSRHYESKSVAKKLWDGTWVGWTYWYGDGKHGEPGAIDWVEDAYFLNAEERTEIVLHFSKQ